MRSGGGSGGRFGGGFLRGETLGREGDVGDGADWVPCRQS